MNSAVELSFKVRFVETILAGPMNSARDPQKKNAGTLETNKRAIQTHT